MAKNGNLHAAKAAKNDEFYTRIDDIREEMNHYTDKFAGKRVFCNCDDPFESGFVRYFLMNFNRLGLKELMATGYKTSPVLGKELGTPGAPYAMRVKDTSKYLIGTQTDLDLKGAKTFLESEWKHVTYPLSGNSDARGGYYEAGDFRSDMSLDLLKECDIVVSNPPFSKIRLYIAQLMQYEKQFIIIGNINVITYKECFPLLKNDQMWIGNSNPKVFLSPDGSSKQFGNVMWFTNIDHPKRHQMIDFPIGCTYFGHEDMYPMYDNYNAINIDRTNDIPCDFFPCISVPVSFAEKLDPEKFVLLPDSFEFKRDTRSLGGGEPGTGRLYVKKYVDKAVIYVDDEDRQDAVCQMMMNDYGYSEDEIKRYSGVMGVPISFLDKYCPEQFEIVSFRKGDDGKDLVFTREREREREFNRTFVSLCDVDSGDDKKRRRKNKWKTYLCENNDSENLLEPVDIIFPLIWNFGGNARTRVHEKITYGRIVNDPARHECRTGLERNSFIRCGISSRNS